MARAAVPGRLTWRVATVAATRQETPSARTLVLDVPGWPGHLPGQHVDVRLTAEDGHSAQRSYSIASAPGADQVELTVQRLGDGEVSPYLSDVAAPGDQFELRGPAGGWFTWHPGDAAPLLLLAGGSGIVPLMSMIRAHGAAESGTPIRLIYSVRSPADVMYASELSERSRVSPLTVTRLYTRAAPASAPSPPPAPSAPPAQRIPPVFAGRLSTSVITAVAFSPAAAPSIFVCGPAGFVETAASLLVESGHPPAAVKTERFGPTS